MALPEVTLPVTVETAAPFGKVIQPVTPGAEITDIPVSTVRDLAREHHILVLRGFRPFATPEDLAGYAASWGQVMM